MKRNRTGIKIRGILMAGVIFCILSGTGCSGEEIPFRGHTPEDRDPSQENSYPQDTDQETDVSPDAVQGRALSVRELEQWTDFVNRKENNGFLLCHYEKVREMDPNEVLYNGAGMETAPLPEEIAAYEACGYTVETDIFLLRAEDIDSFLERKTGLRLEDMEKELDWIYLKSRNSYITQHGDTNFCYFACTEGRQKGDEYELECRAENMGGKNCRVTLRKTDEGYQFVSNVFLPEDTSFGRIEDQCFSLNLNGFGEVEFVSCKPNQETSPLQDVTFELWKGGTRSYIFPGVTAGNLRMVDSFVNIDAVSFKDYNFDGYLDVIVICTYERLIGERTGEQYREARIYKGSGTGFCYMDELSFSVNVTQNNQSISQILKQLRKEETAVPQAGSPVGRQLKKRQ